MRAEGAGSASEDAWHDGKDVDSLVDWARVRDVLAEEQLAALSERGFVVVDGFWGREWSAAFRAEMDHLVRTDSMRPNKTAFTDAQGRTILTTKPNIYELDLHDSATRRQLPVFSDLFAHAGRLVNGLDASCPDLRLDMRPSSDTCAIKLQYNGGDGACFPLHYDNPGKPNRRQVTMLTYLNPDWREGDGGELQLVPWLSTPVVIPPKMDRVVFFLSDRVLHRVLPARAERFCFTIWMDGTHTNLPEHNMLDISQFQDLESLCGHLALSPAQRLLARGVYESAFARSIKECMRDAKGCREMVAQHQMYIDGLSKNRVLESLVKRLRDYLATLMELQDFTL